MSRETIFTMESDIINKKQRSDAIFQLGVLITDPTDGLIVNTLKTNFYEKFNRFELLEAWACMVDEVNRLDTVIKLHDELVHRGWDQEDKIEKLEKENKKLRKANESLFKKNLKELE